MNNKKYLISAALESEINPLLSQINNVKKSKLLHVTIWEGKLYDKDIVIYETGVGRTNAASSTSILISHFHNYELSLINIGSCGGATINNAIFSTVIGINHYYFEVDVPGYIKGQIPYLPQYFSSSEKMLSQAKNIFSSLSNITFGNEVCAERFIDTKELVREVHNLFPNVNGFDMESTSIAHIAYLNNLDFISIRTVTDNVMIDQNNAMEQFDVRIKKVGEINSKVLLQFLNSI